MKIIKNRKMKALVALAALLPSFTTTISAQNNDRAFEVARQIDIFSEAYKVLDTYYVDTLDAQKVIRTGIDAMFSSLDPYTEYYPEDDADDLKMLTQAKYEGIGSIIRMQKDSTVIIADLYEGMPAANSGLQVGDVLLKIDNKDLKGLKTADVSKLLRGEPGTSLMLKFQRPGESKPRTVKITRQSIKISAQPYYGMVNNTGYINLHQFTNDCFTYVRKAVISLKEQGATSIVIDLRDNGGGSLEQAVKIVNLIVPKGEKIVETKGKVRASSSIHETKDTPLDLNIPLAVLVNNNSASASEIVAGSLQDLDRAVIVGRRTYGKGLVQIIRELPYNANMKLTTAKYYIPSGRCIQEIDYKMRRADNESGKSAQAEADSVFYTKNNRKVISGKGIAPDVTVKLDTVQNIVMYLSNDDVITKYGTKYFQSHQKPASVQDFALTDQDFEDFKKMVIESDFKYDKLSDKQLSRLKEVAVFEGYYEDAKAEFEALENKLTHNLEYDLDRCKKDICKLLSTEIIKRWYYESGVIQESIKDDPDLNKAIEILNDKDEYNKILGIQ